MNNEPQNKKISDLLAKCWTDESFKQSLLSDANATLRAEGVVIPEGITVNVLENTRTVINYILPPTPQAELSDADLAQVAGGRANYMDENGKWHGSSDWIDEMFRCPKPNDPPLLPR